MKIKEKIVVRKGVITDMAAVHQLVVELAIYENEPDAVTTTPEYYEQSFREGCFEVIVAEYEQEVIGMMLYYMTFSTWKGRMVYLEDFVVQNQFRRYGVGQQLFNAFMAASLEKDAKLVKWQVLDWNKPAIDFYKKNKATIEQNWWNCKIFL